ncbi:hypothetical protein SERN_2371 [Serinibacter arcticus]|uniref:Uncharacterized protein n=1 Tax=Serinibacter arcticus TaxID=1655435 RepID=A0A4Z1E122_9MICO|nr:hypothetical protein SERN_2371 [Serinibacter arcticus]
MPATSATAPTPATAAVRSARAIRFPTDLILDNPPPLPYPLVCRTDIITDRRIAVVTCLTR